SVATMTEIHHFLRLLYVKLGTQMCPDCNVEVSSQTPEQIAAQLIRDHKGHHIGLLAPLVLARKGYYTDLAKWAQGKGYTHLRVDGEFIPVSPWPRLDRYKEHTIELPVADLIVDPNEELALRQAIRQALEHGHGTLTVLAPLTQASGPIEARRTLDSLGHGHPQHFSVKRACPCCGTSFPEPDPRMFSYNSKHGW
ncbi:MAG TPA: excinuclease ABC subunit A, partial [Pusillimonas sp.]|nr:excinuclease ABC subunit A [Pusillimonas sp.]